MTRRQRTVLGWTLALAAIALFASLGTWQVRRAGQKQAMLDAADRVLAEREARSLAVASDPARTDAYDWAEGAGRFDERGPFWLDNQQRDGRVGVRAYRLFRAEGMRQPLLVDLGWLPLAGDRTMPAVPRPDGRLVLRGLLTAPPSAGLPLGAGIAQQSEGWLLTRVDTQAIAEAARLEEAPAPRVLRLDPTLPLGYERDLALLANTLPPDKHRGYALQWFALALAVLATALILTFRKSRRHDS